MYYFEFANPYYALIKAKNDEDAVHKYIEIVAGDDSEFENLLEECEIVTDHYAVARFSRAVDEDGMLCDLEEILKVLESDKSELLIIDGSLI